MPPRIQETHHNKPFWLNGKWWLTDQKRRIELGELFLHPTLDMVLRHESKIPEEALPVKEITDPLGLLATPHSRDKEIDHDPKAFRLSFIIAGYSRLQGEYKALLNRSPTSLWSGDSIMLPNAWESLRGSISLCPAPTNPVDPNAVEVGAIFPGGGGSALAPSSITQDKIPPKGSTLVHLGYVPMAISANIAQNLDLFNKATLTDLTINRHDKYIAVRLNLFYNPEEALEDLSSTAIRFRSIVELI